MRQITFIQPDDWHAHLRDGTLLARTVPDLATYFRRAVIMPNLTPPITELAAAFAYQQRIQAAVPAATPFTPLMTLYLTDNTSPTLMQAAKTQGIIGCKLYPAHVTTNAAWGVRQLDRLTPVFAAMEAVDLPLLIHGEVVDAHIDIFDREAVFIENVLLPLTHAFPRLRIVLEHITTEEAVAFVTTASPTIAATITAHHLHLNRNDLLVGGIRPHFYCLPLPKRRKHQDALITAATSGNPKFFLGTDSAPHLQTAKENSCGCAGVYTGFHALSLYLEIFDAVNKLDYFENFASVFGANFYQLPVNQEKITFAETTWEIPPTLSTPLGALIPFKAGQTLTWQKMT